MTLNEDLQDVLRWSRAAVPGLSGAIVAGRDGMSIAHSLESGDQHRIAAMAAVAVAVATRICQSVSNGPLAHISFVATGQRFYVYPVDSRAVLVMLAGHGVKPALIELASGAAVRRIEELFDDGT